MDYDFRDFDSLLVAAIGFVQKSDYGVFYASSSDGGFLSLRVEDELHDNFYYKTMKIMNINVPEQKQRQGVYTKFLKDLDHTMRYGIRWHDSVENPHLANRHKKHGYYASGNSYYNVVGSPESEAYQKKRKASVEAAEAKLILNISNPVVGLGRKKVHL